MARASEILFVDRSVSDLQIILGSLQSEVQAVVLDDHRPAARQIAEALEGHSGLDAVHIIAHGAPGRVHFTAGAWSIETLEDAAADLATIGKALHAGGDLRLWSCETGRGKTGETFIQALEDVTSTDVRAAAELVGSAAQGGTWDLAGSVAVRVRPPLTENGVAHYPGVLSMEVTLTGTIDADGPGAGMPVQYYIRDSSGVIVYSFSLPSEQEGGALLLSSASTIVNVPGPGTYTIVAYRQGNATDGQPIPYTMVTAGTFTVPGGGGTLTGITGANG